ncbi:iron ABC transporter permease, partial [Burkholderia sp. Tr-860]|nr:iron ABC transporter permease [Burkholderia sp. Tr-860]
MTRGRAWAIWAALALAAALVLVAALTLGSVPIPPR